MSPILSIAGVTKHFGAFTAVNDFSLNLESGTIGGLIGPNGAGKSTLFNIVAGVFKPDAGEVHLDNATVTSLPAHKMFSNGLLRTFQIPHEYSYMTAIENLLVVPEEQIGEQLHAALFLPGKVARQEAGFVKQATEVIEFLGLKKVKNELAGNLSGGQKKLLELGRTMMVDAKIVLLDEIGAGVNRTLLNTLVSNIQKQNDELGRTFFIIEHNMEFISKLCHHVTVMVEGEMMTDGSPEEVLSDPQVVDAYFGGGRKLQQ